MNAIRSINDFAIVFLAEKDESICRFLKLTDHLEEFAWICGGLLHPGQNLPDFVNYNTETMRNLFVCRLVRYVRQRTGKWHDREVGKLVAVARGKPSSGDYRGEQKTRRNRYYADLKPYLDHPLKLLAERGALTSC